MEGLNTYESEAAPEQNNQLEIDQAIKNPELYGLVEGRKVVDTRDALYEIIRSTEEVNLRDLSELLLLNDNVICNSTVLRGETFNGQGIGQAILRGSVEEPLVQVVVVDGYYEPINLFKNEYEFIPLESNIDDYNRTVLHELVHSFTRYIVSTYNHNLENLLNENEKEFYNKVVELHESFLSRNATGDEYLDKLDEYVSKALTSNLSDKGHYDLEEFNSIFPVFKNFYLNNDRKIKSISVALSDEVENI